MSLPVQRKVLFGFGAAMIVLAAIGAASYRSLSLAVESTGWVKHTHEVLEALATIQQDLIDAETGQRGYLITGDRGFLLSHRTAVRAVERDLRQLRGLVVDNPVQLARFDALRERASRELGVLRANVALYDQGQAQKARIAARSTRGELQTDRARSVIERMVRAEQALLDEREERERESVRLAFAVIVSGFAMALLVTVLATVTIGRDIRTRERIGAELEEALVRAQTANRAKSDFLARMSHELRTPLNSVIGFANVLLKNRRSTFVDQDLSYLERIQSNGRQLLALINDILDLAKIESGKVDLELANIDVGALVAETIRHFDAREGVVVETDLASDVAMVSSDAAKLRQVLLNLLSNAAKFTDRGHILIRLIADPATRLPQRIDVVDEGIGIAPDRLHAIFNAFEQAEVTTARRFGGTGLGLAISRLICERLGYRLTVASTPGHGSTFSILFSAVAAPPARHESPRAIHATPTRLSVIRARAPAVAIAAGSPSNPTDRSNGIRRRRPSR